MKYKTFRALVLTGAAMLVGLGFWQCMRADQAQDTYGAMLADQDRALEQRNAGTSQGPRQVAAGSGGSGAGDIPGLAGTVGGQTPEAYLLATLGGAASEEKLKDVTGGRGSKINVYNEGGRWARAKVDHDRDEKWDEKWSLDGAIVVRQIAPNDDDNYTRELRRLGDAWFEAGAAVAGPGAGDAATVAAATPTGRPLDDAVLRALEAPAQEKIKDATGSTPYKVNLYSDDGLRWNRVKIDLDRDEKWDEKWTIAADGSIEREVAPADDEQYSEKYQRTGTEWVRR